MAARITLMEDTVVWDAFKRLNETYPLRFEFDRGGYEGANPRAS